MLPARNISHWNFQLHGIEYYRHSHKGENNVRALKKLLKMAYVVGLRAVTRQVAAPGNRVLIYHAFGTRLSFDTYGISISLERFRRHIEFIAARYRLIQLDPATFSRDLSENTLSISIDDGYEDNLQAAQILTEHRVPFLILITTDFIGRPGYLSPPQIRELATTPWCRIGAHGKSHRHLARLPEQEQRQEMTESKAILEGIIGRPVDTMSYPHGSHSKVTKRIAREAGYELVLSSISGTNTPDFDRFAVRRNEIVASDSIADVVRKIRGYYDRWSVPCTDVD